jgi:hydrogenase maturation protein HypF
VQGVGFRPHVYGLARRFGLAGFVYNDKAGVVIEAQGEEEGLCAFEAALQAELPPLARLDGMQVETLPCLPGHMHEKHPSGAAQSPCSGEEKFRILPSPKAEAPPLMSVGPDMAPCPACLQELFSPADRRFLYPFLNCTCCGPRYALSLRMPWDRPNTTLAGFPMCEACTREYENPENRRFHAQPTACPACGPKLEACPQSLARCIAAGGIVALKAAGGFQLACDARNEAAVLRLRQRKMRDAKPFAIMVPHLEAARCLAVLTKAEEALLQSPERPIVLVRAREADGSARGGLAPSGIARAVAPGLAHLGLCLPSTPLHEVLFYYAEGGEGEAPAWVMTSANFSGEPLLKDNEEALSQLSGLADAFALHNRPIAVRMDDSLMQVLATAPQMLRRARGFVPRPLPLPWHGPPLLAVGGHLKSTFCLVHDNRAYVSQHLGDLDSPKARASFCENIEHLCNQLKLKPELLAADLHPEYFSTQWAMHTGLPCLPVQHHFAHVAATWAEYPQVKGPLLGLALDGVGLGSDGLPWGGELLWLEGGREGEGALRWQRLGHLKPLPLYGGDAAAMQPWRMAVAAHVALGEEARALEVGKAHGLTPALLEAWKRGTLFAPLSSSLGRFFDAAACLLGLCALARFEAEGPMLLEALAHRALFSKQALPWPLGGHEVQEGNVLSLHGLLGRVAAEEALSLAPAAALWLHEALAEALAAWTADTARHRGLVHVALGGGCLQNRLLCEGLVERLMQRGLCPLLPRQLPPNDGGICLGQALAAAQHFG